MNMNLQETWRHAAKIKTFIHSFSYNSLLDLLELFLKDLVIISFFRTLIFSNGDS